MIKKSLIAVVRFYQRFLSPLKRAPTCRYVPTCSSYAIDAIIQRGALVGSAMAVWRILRCNPLFPGGYDPVLRPAAARDALPESVSSHDPEGVQCCGGEHGHDKRPHTQSVRM